MGVAPAAIRAVIDVMDSRVSERDMQDVTG